jgi:NAD(P)-dependent dehydrogenase (short-subunit alcohol dehydrogenase family)
MNKGGSIVNTASVCGIAGFAKCAPYVASKHAVIGLTKTAAKELGAKGIRCNAICP